MLLTLEIDSDLLNEAEAEVEKAYAKSIGPRNDFTLSLVDETMLTKKGKEKAMRAMQLRALRSRSFLVCFLLMQAFEEGDLEVDNTPAFPPLEIPKTLREKLEDKA